MKRVVAERHGVEVEGHVQVRAPQLAQMFLQDRLSPPVAQFQEHPQLVQPPFPRLEANHSHAGYIERVVFLPVENQGDVLSGVLPRNDP